MHNVTARQTCKYTLPLLCDDTAHEVKQENEEKVPNCAQIIRQEFPEGQRVELKNKQELAWQTMRQHSRVKELRDGKVQAVNNLGMLRSECTWNG